MARKHKFDAALGSASAKQLTAVSLFCGAGGMDVGFNRAAFKTIWAADIRRMRHLQSLRPARKRITEGLGER